MSLFDALNKVKSENYDPKKDKVGNGFELIPDGTYTVTLSNVDHGAWESGVDYVQFVFEVTLGDQAGRKEYYRPILSQTKKDGTKMPDSVLIRSIKTIQKIGAMVGFEVPDSCFMGETESDDYEEIQNAFRSAGVLGKVLTLEIKSSPNKKDPDNPYRNLAFSEAEQPQEIKVEDPFKDQEGPDDSQQLSDKDIPF